MRVQAYRVVRKWEKGDKTHAEAEADNGSKAAATPDGNHRDVEGSILRANLCGYHLFRRSHISVTEDKEGGLGRDL